MRGAKKGLWSLFLVSICWSCDGPDTHTIPPPPATAQAVQQQLAGKNFHTAATGYYGALTINDKPSAEWLDSTKVQDKMIKDVLKETNAFSLNFTGDTSVTVGRAGNNVEGEWLINNESDEDEEHGIYLRISFKDPEFKLPSGEIPKVTYSYQVKGVSEKAVLLELPREINRRKLVSLMEL